MSEEKIFFEKDNIQVTRSLVRISAQSYPIANIGSVRIETKPGSGKEGTAIVFGVLTITALWISVPYFQRSQYGEVIFGICCAVGFAFAAFQAAMFKTPASYTLFLRTSSADQPALRSDNKDLISGLKAAIEAAIVSRGERL